MIEATTPPADAFRTEGNWTREQSVLAFKFYCETPFGQLSARNKKVIALAALIGRTANAVALKCVNFASIDPAILASGRRGMGHASKAEQAVWDEFHGNWDALVEQCEALTAYLRQEKKIPEEQPEDQSTDEHDFTGDVRRVLTNQRVKQRFFRRAVLSGYGQKCCISGVTEPCLLVASHIVPWSEDVANRLNPSNGLCLSAIHDRAFDGYLFSLTDDYRIVLSKRLKKTKDKFLREAFWPMQDRHIALPKRFQPDRAFVRRHRDKMLGM